MKIIRCISESIKIADERGCREWKKRAESSSGQVKLSSIETSMFFSPEAGSRSMVRECDFVEEVTSAHFR